MISNCPNRPVAGNERYAMENTNKTIEQAEADLASAKAVYLAELERDLERGEGSGAQERRREEYQESLRDVITQCERVLEGAKRRQSQND